MQVRDADASPNANGCHGWNIIILGHDDNFCDGQNSNERLSGFALHGLSSIAGFILVPYLLSLRHRPRCSGWRVVTSVTKPAFPTSTMPANVQIAHFLPALHLVRWLKVKTKLQALRTVRDVLQPPENTTLITACFVFPEVFVFSMLLADLSAIEALAVASPLSPSQNGVRRAFFTCSACRYLSSLSSAVPPCSHLQSAFSLSRNRAVRYSPGLPAPNLARYFFTSRTRIPSETRNTATVLQRR